MFYMQPSGWTLIEQKHLEGFKTFLLANYSDKSEIPEDYPEQEVLRTLHGTAWNYKQTYLDIL